MPAAFPLESYLNVRSATAPSFAPDGRSVAFLSNITGLAQAWLVPAAGGWPTQLTFTRDSVRGVSFSPVKHELVFTMDAGGDERTQLHRIRGVAGGHDHGLGDGWAAEPLCPAPRAVHQFGGFSRDGSQIAFSANRDDPSRFDVYVLKLGDKEPRRVAKGPGGYFSVAGWSPDGRTLLVRRAESNANQDLYLVPVAGGEARRLTPHDGDAVYDSPVWSHDGSAVYCASTAGGRDLAGLARIDAATGELEYAHTPAHEVEAVAASPKGRGLLWVENQDGRAVLYRWNPSGPAAPPAHLVTAGGLGGLEFAPDGETFAYVPDAPRANPDVWLRTPSGTRQLTFSSRAGLPFSTFAEPELVRYKTFDGRMIPAWFYKPRPAGGRLPPVIVYPHGGPESQTRPGFNALFQYFVSAGYGVFAPNVRGSSGYGQAYMNLDNVRKRMDSVTDLAHAAYWLRDGGHADPKRLAVYGGSYGGFMVLASVTNSPDLWAAGIDVVGIANFVTFLENTGAYRRAHREKEYGSLERDREFLERISPLRHADRIRCPMMVVHGANDPRVPVGEAEQIVAALKTRGVPVEYLRYEDEGHGVAKLKNRLDCYPRMVAFLDRHLG